MSLAARQRTSQKRSPLHKIASEGDVNTCNGPAKPAKSRELRVHDLQYDVYQSDFANNQKRKGLALEQLPPLARSFSDRPACSTPGVFCPELDSPRKVGPPPAAIKSDVPRFAAKRSVVPDPGQYNPALPDSPARSWSKTSPVMQSPRVVRLESDKRELVDAEYDNARQSSLRVDDHPSVGFASSQKRFVSPAPAPAPGSDRPNLRELDDKRRAAEWARQTSAMLVNRARFPDPMPGLGPGEFRDEVEIDGQRAEVAWEHQREVAAAQSPEQERLKIPALLNDVDVHRPAESFPDGGEWQQAMPRFPDVAPDKRDYDLTPVHKELKNVPAVDRVERFPGRNGPNPDFVDAPEGDFFSKVPAARPGCIGNKDRLVLLPTLGADCSGSVFQSSAPSAASASARLRFPSPRLGKGPGEYGSAEEYAAAKRAIEWARTHLANMEPHDRFPSPPPGPGPCDFATREEWEVAKRAIVVSRLQSLTASQEGRLQFSPQSGVGEGAGLVPPVQPNAGAKDQSSVMRSLRQRLPSPKLGKGPGEYESVEEFEAAKKAVEWARTSLARGGDIDRFPSPKLGRGPGEYSTEEELDAARRAIMVARLQGQVTLAAHPGLDLHLSANAQLDYHPLDGRLSGAEEEHKGHLQLSARERFPSPVLGLGPGEYSNAEDLEAARAAVLWARTVAGCGPQRFPSPRLGTGAELGPGVYATVEELEAARTAIRWSRQQGQIGAALQERLNFERLLGADTVYDVYGSDFADGGPKGSSFASRVERFPEPSAGPGPGQYATPEEVEQLRLKWDRPIAALAAHFPRFPDGPSPKPGPGAYKAAGDLEQEGAEMRWARQQALEEIARYTGLNSGRDDWLYS